MQCIHCKSENTKKNGHGSYGLQRYLCKDCHLSFSTGWKRWTYSPEFKQQVVDAYCHEGKKAREVVEQFKISSRTLVSWKKKHLASCKDCKKSSK